MGNMGPNWPFLYAIGPRGLAVNTGKRALCRHGSGPEPVAKWLDGGALLLKGNTRVGERPHGGASTPTLSRRH